MLSERKDAFFIASNLKIFWNTTAIVKNAAFAVSLLRILHYHLSYCPPLKTGQLIFI